MKPLTVLSWGCGVQSTTIAVMAALGDLPPIDVVIHADTQWERTPTIELRAWYTDWLRQRGQQVAIVTACSVRTDGASNHIHIPFWTETGGPLKRQCTRNNKIRPVKRRTRQLLGLHPSLPPNPQPHSVRLAIGFSLDEDTRIKLNPVQFIDNHWPLVSAWLTRQDCINYLTEHNLPIPVKSACIGCPYRQASEWIKMRNGQPHDFADAIAFDEENRHNPLTKRGNSTADALYIYKHGGPLADADLEADAAREREPKPIQLPLLCESGYCWT